MIYEAQTVTGFPDLEHGERMDCLWILLNNSLTISRSWWTVGMNGQRTSGNRFEVRCRAETRRLPDTRAAMHAFTCADTKIVQADGGYIHGVREG